MIQEAISEYLITNGIKQVFLAEKCGWTPQKMSAILNKKQKLEADSYGEICEALNLPYDFFFKKSGS